MADRVYPVRLLDEVPFEFIDGSYLNSQGEYDLLITRMGVKECEAHVHEKGTGRVIDGPIKGQKPENCVKALKIRGYILGV